MKKRIINRYPDINTFGSRLIYLYDYFGLLIDGKIDFTKVANDLYNKHLREYSISCEDKAKNDSSRLKNTADTLRKHLDITSGENISGLWLNIYCKYFSCSCDFLMGYIERPSHEKIVIPKVTGLSDKAIDTLKALNNEYPTIRDTTTLQAVNSLLSSSGNDVLYNMGVYLGLNDDTMQAYIDSNDCFQKVSPSSDTMGIVLHLAGGSSLVVDDNTICTSLIDNIRRGLDKIKAL